VSCGLFFYSASSMMGPTFRTEALIVVHFYR